SMYSGVSPHELLDALTGTSPRSAYEIIRHRWQGQNPAPDFETKWGRSLSEGVVTDLIPPRTKAFEVAQQTASLASNAQASLTGLEIVFRADVNVRDGRYANNPWLQELPRQ